MIKYEQMPKTSEEFPPDVILVTDDNDAEMAKLKEMVDACGFEDIELPEQPTPEGKFRIVIPGVVVGEFSECVYEIDDGKLDELTEKWNQEAIEAE